MEGSPLIVIAHPDEAQAFKDIPHELLVTGFGKVTAAVSLAKRLSSEPRPSEVLVFGTAGRIDSTLAFHTVYEITQALEYDAFGVPSYRREQPTASHFPPAVIGTGGSFLDDPAKATELRSQGIQLVDMESSVYLQVAEVFSMPIRIFKIISDDADAEAPLLWDKVAPELSRRLHETYLQLLEI